MLDNSATQLCSIVQLLEGSNIALTQLYTTMYKFKFWSHYFSAMERRKEEERHQQAKEEERRRQEKEEEETKRREVELIAGKRALEQKRTDCERIIDRLDACEERLFRYVQSAWNRHDPDWFGSTVEGSIWCQAIREQMNGIHKDMLDGYDVLHRLQQKYQVVCGELKMLKRAMKERDEIARGVPPTQSSVFVHKRPGFKDALRCLQNFYRNMR